MEQGNWDLLFSQFQLPCRVAEESCWTGCWLVIPPRWNQPQRRWCQSGVQCLSFCRVSHLCENVLTQIEYWYPHYIWSQKCYCRIASWLWSSWDCRLENEEGEVFLKVISTTYEKTESHIPCICETTDWEWEMSTFQGKLKIVFHVWFCCFFFLMLFWKSLAFWVLVPSVLKLIISNMYCGAWRKRTFCPLFYVSWCDIIFQKSHTISNVTSFLTCKYSW